MCAWGAPKPTSVPIIPSSTTPIPPGVRGKELITRPIAHARKASLGRRVSNEMPTARRDSSNTRYALTWLRSGPPPGVRRGGAGGRGGGAPGGGAPGGAPGGGGGGAGGRRSPRGHDRGGGGARRGGPGGGAWGGAAAGIAFARGGDPEGS